MSATASRGMLAIWHDVAAGSDDAVTHWYNTEHHAERLGIAGFVEASRFRLAGGLGPQYFCLYRTRNPGVLYSAAYRARVDAPTQRTREIMPNFRNTTRSVCRLALAAGRPAGGCVATLAGAALPGAQGHGAWNMRELFSDLLQLSGVLRCRWLLVDDSALPAQGSAELRLRGKPDDGIGWAAVIDTNEPHQSLDALVWLEDRLQPEKAGHRVLQRAAYRLVYAASAKA